MSALPKLLSSQDTAELLGIAAGTLDSWRSKGQGPDFIKLEADRVAYDPQDVQAYLERMKVRLSQQSFLYFPNRKRGWRPAEILGIDHHTQDGRPVYIVAVYRVFFPDDRPGFCGRLAFVCPACGNIHMHGAMGPNFGDGNSQRSAFDQCTNLTPLFSKQGYHLQEVDNPYPAGSLPERLIRERRNRDLAARRGL